MVSATFQNVQIADQVGVGIGMRIFQRVANASLSGQMDHAVKLLFCEQLCDALAIGKIDFMETEKGGLQ